MFKIVLLCAGGASTGMLARKMEEEAAEVGLACEVEAHGVAEAAAQGADASVVMLGPQVGYRMGEVQKALPGKPVLTIDMADYGRMNAKKILKQAVRAYKEAQK